MPSNFDVKQYLNSHKFTILFSGGKDSLATLLWVLDNIQHEKFSVVYIEVTGNTHKLSNQYVEEITKTLGLWHKTIFLKREIDFFDAMKRWKIPLLGKYRWCMYQFKVPLIKSLPYRITVDGIRNSDSYRRSKIAIVDYMRMTDKIAIHPIINWPKRQVIDYITKKWELPLNPCYRLCGHSGNCMFCPGRSRTEIILTLQDPYWRKKIISTLLNLDYNSLSPYQKRIYDRWIRLAQQTTITQVL